MHKQEKTVGILGGMGPEATVDFYNRIVKSTPARKDQDHIRTVILSDPKVPDRTEGILGRGESPFARLQSGLDTLVHIGVEIIAIPCVSSHYFFEKFRVPGHVILLSIVKETALYTLNKWPEIKRVAVLGTDVTVQMDLFGKYFSSNGVTLLFPSPKEQKEIIMDAIYLVKSGKYSGVSEKLRAVVNRLKEDGAQAVIAGCTEIPLVFKARDMGIPMVDTLQCLADAVVREALHAESGLFVYGIGD